MRETGSANPGAAPSRSVPFIVLAASLTVAVAGLKLAGDLLIPIVVAAFVAILCVPAVRFLERLRVPGWLAVLLVLVFVLGSILGLTVAVVDSMVSFTGDLPAYQERFKAIGEDAITWLEGHGVELASAEERGKLDPSRLLTVVGSAAGTAIDTFSSILLVLLLVIFMLAEAAGLPAKIRRAMGHPDEDLSEFKKVGKQVWAYLAIKTFTSLLTGILWGVFLAIVGLDYPVLWGLIAFLLNFIPNIGSLLAAVPAVLLALVQPGLENAGWISLESGLGAALLVALGNLAINQVIGNVIEPKVMGAKLGLSPLVVFLSLVFWSWLWGPAGMLLSVPLTQVLKILLENFESTKPIAILLGPDAVRESPAAAEGAG